MNALKDIKKKRAEPREHQTLPAKRLGHFSVAPSRRYNSIRVIGTLSAATRVQLVKFKGGQRPTPFVAPRTRSQGRHAERGPGF